MTPLIGPIVNGIFNFFSTKQKNKAAVKSAQAKLAAKKADNKASIELSDAEWEALAVKGLDNSWKDEYITIIITLPIPFILIGSVISALGFVGGKDVVTGTIDGIAALESLGMDYGLLMTAVVFAGIGLKMLRS